MFSLIEDSMAVLLCKGIYRQTTLFRYGGNVFAKCGAGYIRLMRNGVTSHPHTLWKEIDIRGKKSPDFDRMGNMVGVI